MSAQPVTTYCPACGRTFRVPGDLAGRKIVCKGCETTFIVQPEKPGLPVAATANPRPATATVAVAAPTPVANAADKGSAAVAVAKTAVAAPVAGAAPVSVVEASAAPAAVAPTGTELPPIPFDDTPIPITDGGATAAPMATVARTHSVEKIKIESKGPYFVIKLVTSGKMVHVGVENALNEHATDGWQLKSIFSVSGETYAILYRDPAAPTSTPANPTGA